MVAYDQEEPQEQSGAQLLRSDRKPVVTYVLLAINLLLWLTMELVGECDRSSTRWCSEDPEVLLDFGAMYGPFMADGEYWRLLTAMFLHAGPVHLGFNSLALFIFGRVVEGTYGRVRFVIVYFLAGLSGSVASYGLNSIGVGAGASGAIFGVLGALAAFFVVNRKVLGDMGRQNLSGILVIAVINLVIGFSVPGIDNWAHMGGLGAGFALGLALVPSYRYQNVIGPSGMAGRLVNTNSLAKRWWVLPVAVVALLAAAWLGSNRLPDRALSLTHVHRAERLLDQQSYEDALDEIGEALELDPRAAEAYLLRGKLFAELGDRRLAVVELGKAIGLGLDGRSREEAVSLLVTLGARP